LSRIQKHLNTVLFAKFCQVKAAQFALEVWRNGRRGRLYKRSNMIGCFMHPCFTAPSKNDVSLPETPQHSIKRNPGAAIETTEITNLEGAKVAWKR
jgi:hypothetical protein